MEKAVEPTDDDIDIRGTSYCSLSAERKCALLGSVESGTAAKSR